MKTRLGKRRRVLSHSYGSCSLSESLACSPRPLPQPGCQHVNTSCISPLVSTLVSILSARQDASARFSSRQNIMVISREGISSRRLTSRRLTSRRLTSRRPQKKVQQAISISTGSGQVAIQGLSRIQCLSRMRPHFRFGHISRSLL